jgi:hypothetical protein
MFIKSTPHHYTHKEQAAHTLHCATLAILNELQSKKRPAIASHSVDFDLYEYFGIHEDPNTPTNKKVIGRDLATFEKTGLILIFTPAEFFANFDRLQSEGYLSAEKSKDLPFQFLTYNLFAKKPFFVFHNGIEKLYPNAVQKTI